MPILLNVTKSRQRWYPEGDAISYESVDYGTLLQQDLSRPYNLSQGMWELSPWGTGAFHFKYNFFRFALPQFAYLSQWGFECWFRQYTSSLPCLVQIRDGVGRGLGFDIEYYQPGIADQDIVVYTTINNSYATGQYNYSHTEAWIPMISWTHLFIKANAQTNLIQIGFNGGAGLSSLSIPNGFNLGMSDVRFGTCWIDDTVMTGVRFYNHLNWDPSLHYAQGPAILPETATVALPLTPGANNTTPLMVFG
jgi:hypothetical protein